MPKKIHDFLSSVGTTLGKLGMHRLVLLGFLGVMLVATLLFSSFYLARPAYESLYIGLSRDDVNRIGLALGEAGIAFDVSADGATVRVSVDKLEKARMLLAEKGLPTSSNAGYELFDRMGSLGLTSFMQEITRQRALEGEISRTIQVVRGVRAARIHIVLPDKGSFRRATQKPTASIVIRTDNSFSPESAQAIRHLVSAAVPSLEPAAVTVLNAGGQLLASGEDPSNGSFVHMASLERQLAAQIDENIRKQLAPYLGLGHFQSSVQLELDTDRRQINETAYDPDSQVARSVRSVRDQHDSQNSRNDDAVSVEQNIPQEEIASDNSENSSDRRNRREEIINYEINSKTVSIISDGYKVKKLSVAVLVDRNRLSANKGDSSASVQYINDQISHIRQMLVAAVGLNEGRGDIINVTAVDFLSEQDIDMESLMPYAWDAFMRYLPVLIGSIAMIIAILLILFFGVRPLLYGIRKPENMQVADTSAVSADETAVPPANQAVDASEKMLNDLRQRMRVPPQIRLERMIELDEERFVEVLRDWIRHDKVRAQLET
ncbi:MAG: flagellar M-ring protein FliF [Candidatus Tokpelaia sp. JSC189]|nr:MAG: flagellar M-ring protein FliF [Candidatus Tokpelaia sp. JSC189]